MNDRDKYRIEYIIRHCDEIADIVERADCSEDKFRNDYIFSNACAMVIFYIGELFRRMSDEFKSSHEELPWQEVRDMTHLIIHEFDSMDKDLLWQMSRNTIPALRAQLVEICQADICREESPDRER